MGFLYERGHVLPDRAQAEVTSFAARSDFAYEEAQTLVYVDGAPHRFPERRARDETATAALERAGYTVVRVTGPESWPTAVREHSWIFGPGNLL